MGVGVVSNQATRCEAWLEASANQTARSVRAAGV